MCSPHRLIKDDAFCLTLCMLGNLSSAKMLSAKFLKLAFSSIFFSKNTIRIANSLDPDETPRSVASHLDPNCLQKPSKSGSSTQRAKLDFLKVMWSQISQADCILHALALSPVFPEHGSILCTGLNA
jgi:hypothetical protein